MKKKGSQLGRYLFSKYGTPERADRSNIESLIHETLHNYTQLRTMYDEKGGKIKPFKEVLGERLTERYEAGLPKGLKWLAPYLSHFTSRPILEGVNVVETERTANGLSVEQICHKKRKDPTSYGAYGASAAGAIRGAGVANGLDLYRRVGGKQGNNQLLDGFINGTLSRLSRYIPRGARRAA